VSDNGGGSSSKRLIEAELQPSPQGKAQRVQEAQQAVRPLPLGKGTAEISDTEELDDMRAYEESARRIADKVERQQEGLESALLTREHEDATYLTVDEIQRMLEEQRTEKRKSKLARKRRERRSRYNYFGMWNSRDSSDDEDDENDVDRGPQEEGKATSELSSKQRIGAWFRERAKFIPLRLEYEERSRLHLIQAVMRASNYTTEVDNPEHKSRSKRLLKQMQLIRATLTGIATTYKYDLAQKLVEDQDFKLYQITFTKVFEVGRRYKVMNPDKMRGGYGKMIFLLQDALISEIEEGIGFSLHRPIETVYKTLEARDGLAILDDEFISTATMEILPEDKTREEIDSEIRLKENAIAYIAKKYKTEKLPEERIKRCLYSIGDNTSYLNSNCKPVDYMITLLEKFFGVEGTEDTQWSLALYGGQNGSRITHSHARQFHYVLQTLTLWREIIHDMFRLWFVAEQDLLNPERQYKMRNTGQGIHRLQDSPETSKVMHGILFAVQQRLGHTEQGWVGSNVIHLGDTNVPNALVFIDKYNQVPRILNPIVMCIRYIENHLVKDKTLVKLVEKKYGSIQSAIQKILHDFFRHGFDGSGAENFFEAGSCIDGRMTSCFEWAQKIHEKPYYFLFKLSGFQGFDGDFT